MLITIPYSPRSVFQPFHESDKRWSVLCCHRAAGKTVATINHLIRAATQKPNGIFAFISPTYTQGKRIAWQYIKDFSLPIPGIQWNESELRVVFPNKASIYILGAENPHSLRGMHLDGVVQDEASQHPPSLFGEILMPALASKNGFAVFIGTILGKNMLWKLHEEHKNDPKWFTLYLKASESGILSQETLETARKNMSEDEYEQEYELNPTASVKGAYYAEPLRQARKEDRITKVPYTPFLPVDTYWDLGIGDKTAIGFFQTSGTQTRLIDCLEGTGKGLDYYVRCLRERGYIYGTHRLPHDIKVRELGSGRSRLEILQTLLHEPIEIVKTIPIQDGINAVRMRFKQLWIDEEKCSPVIESLEQYRKEWDDDHGLFKDKPLHDWTSHYADMMRYWAVSEMQEGLSYARDDGMMGQTGDALRSGDDVIQW